MLEAPIRTVASCPALEAYNSGTIYPQNTKFSVDWTDIYTGGRSPYVVTLNYYSDNNNYLQFVETISSTDGSRHILNMYRYEPFPDFYLCGSGTIEPPSCVPNWQCGAWAGCVGANQQRTCQDGCGQTKTESQACSNGNGGSQQQCQTYNIPNCNVFEKLTTFTNTSGCNLPSFCSVNVDVTGPIIFLIIVAIGGAIAFVVSKKKK